MIAAIDVVVAELEENAQRIRADDAPSQVTFGDWATNKGALAGLSLRDLELWQKVVAAYGQTYAWQQNPESKSRPSPDDLTDITQQLMKHRSSLDREVGAFSRLLRR
jgi:hypothetical protein